MTNWAKTGRTDAQHRHSQCRYRNRLAVPRQGSAQLEHSGSTRSCRLMVSMNDLSRPAIGLEPVLTTSELAAHLGVPVQTIHDLRHGGRGPRGFRIGRELRYRVSEIEAWLAGLEEPDDAARSHEGSRR